jgi:nucleotide-binding universal stress UspA family protein
MEFQSIVVPVAGTGADEGAIDLAFRLAKKKDGSRIIALHVIPVERSLPLGAEVEPEINKAEKILAHIEEIAKEQDFRLETDIIQAREVGSAIVDEARRCEADLILLGMPYKKQFGQYCMGEIIPYVLKNAPCRVLLDRQAAKDIV